MQKERVGVLIIGTIMLFAGLFLIGMYAGVNVATGVFVSLCGMSFLIVSVIAMGDEK